MTPNTRMQNTICTRRNAWANLKAAIMERALRTLDCDLCHPPDKPPSRTLRNL